MYVRTVSCTVDTELDRRRFSLFVLGGEELGDGQRGALWEAGGCYTYSTVMYDELESGNTEGESGWRVVEVLLRGGARG